MGLSTYTGGKTLVRQCDYEKKQKKIKNVILEVDKQK